MISSSLHSASPLNGELSSYLQQLYQQDSRRIFATLVRLLHQFDLAEEFMHEAFAIALEQWATQGVPHHPVS